MFATLLLSLLLTLYPPIVHGVGVPIQNNDPVMWAAEHPGTPFITWNSDYCEYPEFMPMLWHDELIPSNCFDNRVLLMFNEPEFSSQGNLEPAEAARIVRKYRDWPGPIYCCGTTWYGIGWQWYMEFLDELGDDVDIIDGLSLHAYTGTNYHLYRGNDEWFAQLAKDHDWPVIISEYGITQADDELRDWFYRHIVELYRPTHMFIFSWHYGQLPDLDMVNDAGELTDWGQWWFRIRSQTLSLPVLYIPFVCNTPHGTLEIPN